MGKREGKRTFDGSKRATWMMYPRFQSTFRPSEDCAIHSEPSALARSEDVRFGSVPERRSQKCGGRC